MLLKPQESVIFAEDFQAMVEWYKTVFQLKVTHQVDDEYHYCNLENEAGVQIGIADANEMGVTLGDRKNNSVVLQFQVEDVKLFFDYLQEHGGNIAFGPSFDEKDKFWFGGFFDLEGNPFWVVDENVP